jgi:hypothetical protein
MNQKRVPSDRSKKDEILSYLDQLPSEFKQDIVNQCVNYMIHFSGDTTIDPSIKTSKERAETRQEFDAKTQEPLDALSRLLHPYTAEQFKAFVQELEGKTDPYAEPDEDFPLPAELSQLVEEAAQVYQQRQAKILEDFGKNFDK